jgi:hypothetical protein
MLLYIQWYEQTKWEKVDTLRKILAKAAPLIITAFLTALLVVPVMADGGGHLWFYSEDPDTLTWPGPNQLPNPAPDPGDGYVDPNYVSSDPDPWLTQSIVISSDDWETPFSIWLACAQFESLNTKLVVSINEAAYDAIDTIEINSVPITGWTPGTPAALAPHGVFMSSEFHGYAEIDVGDLYSPPLTPYAVEITVEITLNAGADISEAKIHFDAYGYTDSGSVIFSPYSHDLNFHVPEAAPILAATSLVAFGIYAYKRKTNSQLL